MIVSQAPFVRFAVPRLRRLVSGAVIAGVVVGVAACAPVSAPAPTSAGQSANGQPSSAAPEPLEPAAPVVAAIDPATVGKVTSLTLNAPDEGVSAEVPRFEGARALSTALEVVRGRMLRQASWDDADSVQVAAQVTSAGAAVVGVQVTSTVTAGGATSVVPAAVWYDAQTQRAYASPSLIEPAQWAAFTQVLGEAATQAGLDAGKAVAALAEESAPYGSGPALGFAEDGSLVVSFGTGVVGDERADVTVSGEEVEPLLSLFGVKAQAGGKTPAALSAEPVGAVDPTLAEASGRPPLTIGPDCMKLKCVALTFDDGPGSGTGKVFDALVAGKASATFFMLGENAKSNAKTVLRGASLGMEVANHSMHHPDLARKSAERASKEIVGTSEVLKEITGETPLLMRPPYGSHNKTVDKIAKDNGLAIVQWSVDTLDWKTRSTPSTVTAATSLAEYNLPIVLMHDIHDSTVAAIPEIVSQLNDAGYTIVTVSEQSLNEGGLLPGHAYCHGLGVSQAGFNCKG